MSDGSTTLKERIERSIREDPIHVFMKGSPTLPQCGFSHRACEALRAAGAASFGHTDVLADLPSYRAALQEVTRWSTIPQVFIGGEFVGGSDVLIEMLENGELQRRLAGARA